MKPRNFPGHLPYSPKALLGDLAETAPEDPKAFDFYGKGGTLEQLESKVAALLGKPAAVFMPSGTMAQQIALRIWSERKGSPQVGLHATSHLERHEHRAYVELHGLRSVSIGEPERAPDWSDFEKIERPEFSSLLLELPVRELGGVLPPWEDLAKISAWARRKEIALHLDGARLWEAQPHYGKSHGEIAALFDSVYVSFYKGLGALAGAVLAGDEDLIQQARIWQRRHGGNLVTLFPYAISAAKALEVRLPRMAEYHAKAREIAELIRGHGAVESITPDPPHSNMMHIRIRAIPERAMAASVAVAERTGIRLGRNFVETERPGISRLELMVGDAALEFTREEAGAFLGCFLDHCLD